jgi:hypothetical protein
MPIMKGDEAAVKEEGGQVTKCAKLNRKTALTWLAVDGVCARPMIEAKQKASRSNAGARFLCRGVIWWL